MLPFVIKLHLHNCIQSTAELNFMLQSFTVPQIYRTAIIYFYLHRYINATLLLQAFTLLAELTTASGNILCANYSVLMLLKLYKYFSNFYITSRLKI